jgi:hypothetical protein
VLVVEEAMNWKTVVPCSVTCGLAGTNALPLITVAPILTPVVAKDAPGPNPAHDAVITVPTGPEVGDSVTVGVLGANVTVPMLPKLSVNEKAEPDVIPGRLTVPVYEPEVIMLELSADGEAVNFPEVTVIGVPAKDASVIVFVSVGLPGPDADFAKPEADTRTEVPAGPVEGVRVTVGTVIMKETASGEATLSDICTL